MARSLLTLIILASLMTCINCNCRRDKQDLFFLTEVRNIDSVNSIYDDMNMIGGRDEEASISGLLYFSSNRNSKGKSFDIVQARYGYLIKKDYRSEDWRANPAYMLNVEKDLLAQMNTEEYSEIGPCVFPPEWFLADASSKKAKALAIPDWYYWLYANNSAGHFDIKFFYCDRPLNSVEKKQLRSGVAHLINSPADDCYPTFDVDNNYIYFCSNRSGRFQIYRVGVDYNKNLGTTLQSERQEAELVRDLSGDGNDKCPYIINNLMVFTSDRSGGQGGFDLYFSKYSQGRWGQPVNMGEKINSPKDEYRPIVNDFYSSRQLNDLLFFSSNREGGKGGFDLYHVGTDIFRK